MENIAIMGSTKFKKYLENIKASSIFPHINLSFISDSSGGDSININDTMRIIENNKIQALVLGPHDYFYLVPYITIPCFVVHPNIQDFLMLHNKIGEYNDTAIILSYKDNIDLSVLETSLNIHYNKFFYHNRIELYELLRHLKQIGYKKIVSNGYVIKYAQSIGLFGYYYFSEKSIENGISSAHQLLRNLERENHYIAEIRTLLENTTCGVIYASDANTTISYINKTTLDLLRCKRNELVQKPLTTILSGKTLERILTEQEPLLDMQFTLCGKDVIGNIVPLKIKNNTLSVCIMFDNESRILECGTLIQQESKRKKFSAHYSFDNIIGNSQELLKTIDKAKRFAMTKSTILINAETGAGKELFAQSIHNYSQRKLYPFVAINCASLPDTLIESELFGYMPNSFTGASSKGKTGLIEIANHGTIFLDDVDALSSSFQSKLLRVMQEHEIIKIGGNAPIPIDVRFIVATNHNLSDMVSNGKFRSDLYFRINILNLYIPPLKKRIADIPILYEYYIEKIRPDIFSQISRFFLSAFRPALSYSYPGNVRELVSIVERFCALFDSSLANDEKYISELIFDCINSDFPIIKTQQTLSLSVSGDYSKDIKTAEQNLLEYYHKKNNCNIAALAKIVGLSRATIYNKLQNANKIK